MTIDYSAIVLVILRNVLDAEGTDFLSPSGTIESELGLTPEENEELTRLRDIARQSDAVRREEQKRGMFEPIRSRGE